MPNESKVNLANIDATKLSITEIALVKQLGVLENIKDVIMEFFKRETYDGVLETYELTATTTVKTLRPPCDEKRNRPKWLWVQIINDSTTTSMYAGVNVGSVNALTVRARENYKIQFGNRKKIELLNYKTISGTAAIRVICGR